MNAINDAPPSFWKFGEEKVENKNTENNDNSVVKCDDQLEIHHDDKKNEEKLTEGFFLFSTYLCIYTYIYIYSFYLLRGMLRKKKKKQRVDDLKTMRSLFDYLQTLFDQSG